MGYVPPHRNETAIYYGSRMPSKSPAVGRVERVEQPFMYGIGNRNNSYYQKETVASVAKRREMEKKLHGKGQQFDVWT